jgi:radical SAM protein with 4Fe4S-binding SPASM domain
MSGPEASEQGVGFLPTHIEYTRYEDSHGRVLKRHLRENRCKWPWERVVIGSQGHVVPCCNDFDHSYSMGNVFEQSFRDIWFGTQYNRFRKTVMEKLGKIPLCKRCPIPAQGNLSFERTEKMEQNPMTPLTWKTTKS